jgi:hypothetical protein
MNGTKRPGGLTALAVINFVFSGLKIIGAIGLFFSMTMLGKIPTDAMTEAQKTQIQGLQNIDPSIFTINIGINVILFVLLLLSGIGYLNQKKSLGRIVGSIYGALGVAGVIVIATMFPQEVGGGFGIMSIIGIIYPVLTLILINTTFKDDLIN